MVERFGLEEFVFIVKVKRVFDKEKVWVNF